MGISPLFPRYPAPVLLRHLAEHPAGIARSDPIIRNIPGDHAARADHRIPASDDAAAIDNTVVRV